MNIISLAHDTSNWMKVITEEYDKNFVVNSIHKINRLNEKEKFIGENILLKSVWDELRDVIRTKLGTIYKIIEDEIQRITEGKESVSIKSYSRLIELMEKDLLVQFSEAQGNQYLFIKNNIWKIQDKNTDYQWLLKKENRIKKYSDTKFNIMSRLNVESIKILCQGNVKVYDQIERIRKTIKYQETDYLSIAEELLKGSHARGSNYYDRMHLLSCLYFTEDYVRNNLVFSTTDEKMINNSKERQLPFELIDLNHLNSFFTRFGL